MTDVQHKCKLVISTPCPVIENRDGRPMLAPISMHWHRHRIQLQVPYGYNAAELTCDGFPVDEARNRVVQRCIETRAEWLFFIDYDVLLPPNAFKQLMYRTTTHPDYDIFSGVYCAKEHPTIPIIYKGWGTGPCWDWKLGDVLDDGIVGVPMGCCLLKLSLFDRLPFTATMPWFKTWDLSDGDPFEQERGPDMRGVVTEDLWFCRRAVDEAKCKILVDTSIQCGHINNATGEIFTLPEDSPPIKRAGIKPPCDIEAHLPVLTDFASRCETVVEFGVRDGHSTKALLAGRPRKMLSYDIVDCPVVEKLNPNGTEFRLILQDAEQADIPECDLLLVDTKHTASHITSLIQKHAGKVRRWFAFHDTDSYGAIGEDGKPGILGPIHDLLGDWKTAYSNTASNGMLILERPKR